MVGTAARWRERGQATVEHVGITIVVALMFVACTAWAIQHAGAPARLPDVIGRVAAPLDSGTSAAPGAVPVLPPQTGLVRRALDGARSWGLLNVDGERQALAGALDEVRSQLDGAIHDPLGTGVRILGMARGLPTALLQRDGGASDAPGLFRYLLDAGTRPFRDTFLHVSRLAGHWAVDWVLARGARWLRLAGPGIGR